MKKDVYVYEYAGKHYINLTNRCMNSCEFCIRNNPVGIEGYDLWLEREPEADEIIDILKACGGKDVVFCGYGEPMMRTYTLVEVAKWVKSIGGTVRINTNGLANAFYGENVVPLVAGCTDVMSISLNQSDADKYDALCHSEYGKAAFGHMLDFACECVRAGIDTVLSIVDVIGEEDIERCRKIAADVGARLRVRTYMKD